MIDAIVATFLSKLCSLLMKLCRFRLVIFSIQLLLLICSY